MRPLRARPEPGPDERGPGGDRRRGCAADPPLPAHGARMRALARRHARGEAGERVFRVGDIEVDFASRRVKRAGQTIRLTPIEYRLLTLLATNAGRVLTHRQILREVWGPAHVEHEHY